jgi:hypothetical protein
MAVRESGRRGFGATRAQKKDAPNRMTRRAQFPPYMFFFKFAESLAIDPAFPTAVGFSSACAEWQIPIAKKITRTVNASWRMRFAS